MRAPSLILGGFLLSALAYGAGADGKIWDGVYTKAQAARGKTEYEKHCTNCHIADLNGSTRGPALKGERFMSAWQNGSVSNLFRKMRDSMPYNYPDTVPEEVKLDILTYLLQSNGFPDGAAELKLDTNELDDIQIVQRGQTGLPNFVLVQMVGCLAQGPDQHWMLTRATEPVATKETGVTQAASTEASAEPLGTLTFRLISANAFQPGPHAGHKMEARGLLYREPGESRLNLTSLAMAGTTCP